MRTLDPFGVRSHERVADVARLGLDREADWHDLHDIVESVAGFLRAPFAVVDVLLDDAQVFLDGVGPIPAWMREAGGTPLEWAFCRPLVRDRVARAVPDLTADPLFRDNPLVTVAGIRAYAGAPLISHSGHVLGGLCALDLHPRPFQSEELAFLQERAHEVVNRLEARARDEAVR